MEVDHVTFVLTLSTYHFKIITPSTHVSAPTIAVKKQGSTIYTHFL